MGKSWAVLNYGKEREEMTDAEIRRYAQVAWNTNDGGELRAFRAEAARRGIVVA